MQCKASVWFAKDRHVLEKIVVEPKPKNKQRNDISDNFKQHFTVYNFLSRAKNYFQKILVLLLFFLIRL